MLRYLLGSHNVAGTGCRIGRNDTLGNEDIDERLHRSRIFVGEKTIEFGHTAEVDEAGVEVGISLRLLVDGEVPEGIDPVRVVEMGVDAEDLTEAGADVVQESFGEACALAEPVTSRLITSGKASQGSIDGRRSCGDGYLGGWSADASGGVSGG